MPPPRTTSVQLANMDPATSNYFCIFSYHIVQYISFPFAFTSTPLAPPFSLRLWTRLFRPLLTRFRAFWSAWLPLDRCLSDPFTVAGCPISWLAAYSASPACLSPPVLSSLLPFPRAGLILASSADFVLGAAASCQLHDGGLLISDFHGVAVSWLLPSALPDRSLLPDIQTMPSIEIRKNWFFICIS